MRIDAFKVEEWFNKYEKTAKYDLADTCIDSMSINDLLELAGETNIEDILSKKLSYGDIHGSIRLKTAISNLYQKQGLNNITVTHGAIGANQLVYLSLVEPDDEVISILPAYQQHYSIPKSLRANVKHLFLRPENDWLPDIEELKQLVTSKTKLICLTNPNNPTGSVVPDDLMKEIISVGNGSYILSDEVYRGIVRKDIYNTTSIVDLYEKGIATSSLSKGFSLAGLRLGWIVANEKIIDEINHQREYNTISVSVLDDYFASIALENKEKIFKRNLEKQKIGYKILSDWVNKEPHITCVLPNGGTTAFLGYDLNVSSYELCKRLLKDTGVLLLPGETLEMNGFVRIGYCNNSERLKCGLNIFSQWIANSFKI